MGRDFSLFWPVGDFRKLCIFDCLAACSPWDGKETAIFGPCTRTACTVGRVRRNGGKGSDRRLRREEGLKNACTVQWWESAFTSGSGWVRKRQVTACWG